MNHERRASSPLAGIIEISYTACTGLHEHGDGLVQFSHHLGTVTTRFSTRDIPLTVIFKTILHFVLEFIKQKTGLLVDAWLDTEICSRFLRSHFNVQVLARVWALVEKNCLPNFGNLRLFPVNPLGNPSREGFQAIPQRGN